jgi:hypothetical protein
MLDREQIEYAQGLLQHFRAGSGSEAAAAAASWGSAFHDVNSRYASLWE